jgi:hypothetical protein
MPPVVAGRSEGAAASAWKVTTSGVVVRKRWLAQFEKNGQRREVRKMCHQVTCETCGRPTWSGCGSHIEQALAAVPNHERCSCDQDFAPASNADSTVGPFTRFFGR